MRLWVHWSLVVAATSCLIAAAPLAAEKVSSSTPGDLVFEGACEGSAGVILGGGVLLVASDSSNWLWEYSLDDAGPPIGRVDLHDATGIHPSSHRNSSAFEALARVGDLVYVMGSHARERKGVNRPNRKRFLAVEVFQEEGREQVRVYGEAFQKLAESMETDDALKRVAIRNAIMTEYIQLPYLAPSNNGLTIQGLAAAKDGTGLLIGLRNPLRGRSATIIPLHNPADVVVKFAAEPVFGEPILLNLEGRGISSIEYSPARSSYIIVAGAKLSKPRDDALFEWSGDPKSRPKKIDGATLGDLRAEGLAVDAAGQRALVLSDDGHVRRPVTDAAQCGAKPKDGKCQCGDLVDPAARSFRARWIDLPSLPAPGEPQLQTP